MDEYTGKRVAGKLGFLRRGSSLTFRDPNHEDKNIQYCSRVGCSSRLHSMKGTQVGDQEKFKYSKNSFRSISSKAIAGASSKSFSSSSDFRKSHHERPKQTSLRETVIAETSIKQGGIEDRRRYNRQELIDDSEYSSRDGETDDSEFSSIASGTSGIQISLPGSEEFESETLGSSTAASTSRPQKQIDRQLGSGKRYIPGSSVRQSFVTRNTTQAAKPPLQGMDAAAQRHRLRNLGCTSISDILPPGCSSSDFGHNRIVDAVRKRPSDGENSSTGGKGMVGASGGGVSGSSHSGLAGPTVRSLTQQASRRGRNQPTNRDGAVSVRTRRAPSGETRMRSHEREDGNIVLPSDTTVSPQLSRTRFSIHEDVPESSSRSFPADLPPGSRHTFGRTGTSGQNARSRSSSRREDNSTQTFRYPLGERDGHRRFNVEGIAEVLLALERIEQDEELTYEQLLVLETNLFLGGLSFHDQHRDMRMDIDNMSYEELLALEEKIGNVSTALSEEALSKCLKRSIYILTGRGGDDNKCSICQEEYAIGDEVGKLGCDHRYHVNCIHHWLTQKNWCPICKAPATPF